MIELNFAKVSVVLLDNGIATKIEPNENGCLGKITPQTATSLAGVKIGHADIGMKINLCVEITKNPAYEVYGCVVDNKKNVAIKRNLCAPSEDRKVYGTHIQIKWSDKANCLHTEYPFNNLRLLRINGGSVVEEWEISITSQGGNFFLSQQKVYSWKVWKDGLTLGSFDQGLNDWPQMLKTLWHIFGTRVNDLPEFTDVLDLDEIESLERITENNMGKVVWWNFSKGMGVINTKYGAARVHWSQIAPYPEMRFLRAGGMVQFKELRKPKIIPGRETKFGLEAIEVENI